MLETIDFAPERSEWVMQCCFVFLLPVLGKQYMH